MTRKIFLIVEDETDIDVVRAFLKAKTIDIRIVPLLPTGGSGGISRLLHDLEKLIETAKKRREQNDCIAILHDADEKVLSDKNPHRKIKRICEQYKEDVKLVIARDEIESWLLADEGLCQWLGEKSRNCDEEKQPSKRLNSLVKKKTKKDYSGRTRMQVIAKLDGTGDKYSPSMRKAIQYLKKGNCI